MSFSVSAAAAILTAAPFVCISGAAAASTGAASDTGSYGDSEFGSPSSGSEFSPEQPLEGDLGGDDFDAGQAGDITVTCA